MACSNDNKIIAQTAADTTYSPWNNSLSLHNSEPVSINNQLCLCFRLQIPPGAALRCSPLLWFAGMLACWGFEQSV